MFNKMWASKPEYVDVVKDSWFNGVDGNSHDVMERIADLCWALSH